MRRCHVPTSDLMAEVVADEGDGKPPCARPGPCPPIWYPGLRLFESTSLAFATKLLKERVVMADSRGVFGPYLLTSAARKHPVSLVG